MILIFVQFLERLSLGAFVGKILFFAIAIAPTVFRILERKEASQLQNAIFPKYFGLGIIFAVVFLISRAAKNFLTANFNNPKEWCIFILAFTVLAIYSYCLLYLTPNIQALQDLSQAPSEEFQTLHKSSVRLNIICLFILLIMLLIF